MNLKKTSITLNNLRFFARHGVLPAEQEIGNDFLVTLTLSFLGGEAMESDKVSDTINYAEVYEVVKREMDIPSKLLEHVSGRILKALGETFPNLTAAECTVTKIAPPIPGFQSSGVSFTCSVTY